MTIGRHPHGHVLQTWEWGQVKASTVAAAAPGSGKERGDRGCRHLKVSTVSAAE